MSTATDVVQPAADAVAVDATPDMEEPAAAAAAAAEQQAVLRYYTRVDLDDHLHPEGFGPLEKLGGLYASRLQSPLVVQTPPVTLASGLEDDEGSPASHAYLLLPKSFAAFACEVEARVLEAAMANKGTWFRRRTVTEDALRAGFKEFCKATGHLKVKVPADALVFDDQGGVVREPVEAGTVVRCLLQLDRVCFGRTEFGAMWSLVQAQVAPPPPPPPRCMIDPSADEGSPARGGGPPDLESEFL